MNSVRKAAETASLRNSIECARLLLEDLLHGGLTDEREARAAMRSVDALFDLLSVRLSTVGRATPAILYMDIWTAAERREYLEWELRLLNQEQEDGVGER